MVGSRAGARAGGAPGRRLWPLFAGGFLGPFGGAMVNTMLPQLADRLGTSTASAAGSITAYMLPFAALMVASGTLATRWGLARTVRVAYGGYVLGSLLCVLATGTGVFMAGRAVQGAANAFTTPLLITMIADLSRPGRLGRNLGLYASMAGAGQAFAPFVGGVAATLDYRWAFGASALTAAALAVLTPSRDRPSAQPSGSTESSKPAEPEAAEAAGASGAEPKRGRARGAPWRPLLNARLARACAIAACGQFTATLVGVVAALLAGDRFGLSPAAGGLVVAAFGAAGLLVGGRLGHVADVVGMRVTGVATLALAAVGVAALPVAPGVALLVACVAACGVGATGTRVLTASLAVASTPANRSGATALMLSAQFLGSAALPVAMPLYAADPLAVCLLGTAAALLGAALTALPAPTAPGTDAGAGDTGDR